jgi:alginate O-acetyltransferase complex protein AlgI
VRARDFLPQLRRHKRFDWDRMYLGVRWFVRGFFKKAILADHIAALVVDPVYARPGDYSSVAVWLAVLAYAVQLYGDFSGYSDMATGLGHLFGYRLPENFRAPFLAVSLGEFWQRWHISLSSWLRDYLYFPLGGSRLGTWKTCRNLLIVMVTCGLWHGACMTFVIFGLVQGSIMSLPRLIPGATRLYRPALRPALILLNFVVLACTLVFIRAVTAEDALAIFTPLVVPTAGLELSTAAATLVAVALLLALADNLLVEYASFRRWENWIPAPVLGATLALLVAAALVLFPENIKTFIYFQY